MKKLKAFKSIGNKVSMGSIKNRLSANKMKLMALNIIDL